MCRTWEIKKEREMEKGRLNITWRRRRGRGRWLSSIGRGREAPRIGDTWFVIVVLRATSAVSDGRVNLRV